MPSNLISSCTISFSLTLFNVISCRHISSNPTHLISSHCMSSHHNEQVETPTCWAVCSLRGGWQTILRRKEPRSFKAIRRGVNVDEEANSRALQFVLKNMFLAIPVALHSGTSTVQTRHFRENIYQSFPV